MNDRLAALEIQHRSLDSAFNDEAIFLRTRMQRQERALKEHLETVPWAFYAALFLMVVLIVRVMTAQTAEA